MKGPALLGRGTMPGTWEGRPLPQHQLLKAALVQGFQLSFPRAAQWRSTLWISLWPNVQERLQWGSPFAGPMSHSLPLVSFLVNPA